VFPFGQRLVGRDTRNVSQDYVAEIGATGENTYYEGYTPLSPTVPGIIFLNFEDGNISKPLNPDLKYIILSSTMYNRYYAEPDKYAEQIAFYNLLKENKPILKQFTPVTVNEVAFEPINIMNSLKTIAGFIRGGYSGPNLIFYEY